MAEEGKLNGSFQLLYEKIKGDMDDIRGDITEMRGDITVIKQKLDNHDAQFAAIRKILVEQQAHIIGSVQAIKSFDDRISKLEAS